MRNLRILPLLLLVVVATNCEKEEEVPEIVPPPPPTPEEIAQEIMSQLELDAPIPPPGTKIPPGPAQQWLGQVRGVQARHASSADGQEALKIVSRRVDQRLRATADDETWEFVVVLCEAHQIFNPGSKKFDRIREEAETELRKPVVTDLLNFKEKGRWTARLKYYLPLTNEEFTESVRPGEEFYGIKLREIIANGAGVELEYLETGEVFQVMARK